MFTVCWLCVHCLKTMWLPSLAQMPWLRAFYAWCGRARSRIARESADASQANNAREIIIGTAHEHAIEEIRCITDGCWQQCCNKMEGVKRWQTARLLNSCGPTPSPLPLHFSVDERVGPKWTCDVFALGTSCVAESLRRQHWNGGVGGVAITCAYCFKPSEKCCDIFAVNSITTLRPFCPMTCSCQQDTVESDK